MNNFFFAASLNKFAREAISKYRYVYAIDAQSYVRQGIPVKNGLEQFNPASVDITI